MPVRLALAALLCCLAFTTACSEDDDSPTGPSPTPGVVRYTALGASDTLGVGGSVVCAPFDLNCPTGTGYVQVLLRRFRTQQPDVQYQNLGVPGAVMSPAIEALAASMGRPVARNISDGQAPFVGATTTHVTIFAGGNDANVIGEAVRAGLGGSDVRGYVDQQVRQWADDYASLIGRIRSSAPNARIVALNVPNLGAAPYVAGNSILERSILQRIAVGLADGTNALASRGVLVVDLLCTGALYAPSNFGPDGFHPSDQGYALLADLTGPALFNGTAPTPASTCAQRTLQPVF